MPKTPRDMELAHDTSLHGGVPKQYYHLKDKVFGEWEIPPWEIQIFMDRCIGKGTFANVYLAKWRETAVVAKVFNTYSVLEKGFLIEREIDIMTKLHHPNIVQILGYMNEPFVIVLEYLPRGDLYHNMHRLGVAPKLKIAKDCLRSLCYLHNRKPNALIHRDIKLSNILLTASGVAKIADFGLSRLTSSGYNTLSSTSLAGTDETSDLTRSVGTERYKAPEMPSSLYTNKVDVFSLGIVFYELFEGKLYHPRTGFRWVWTPSSVRRIVRECMLCEDPSTRKTARATLRHFESLGNVSFFSCC